MRLLPRLSAAVVASAALAAMLVPTGVTAAGPTTHKIDWRLGTKFTPGKAVARGTFKFLDGGKKLSVSARVDDRCPKDTYVVRFFVALEYRDGTKNSTGVIDERGCKPTKPLSLNWTSLPSKSKIKTVRIDFYEHDGKTMQIGDFHPAKTLRP